MTTRVAHPVSFIFISDGTGVLTLDLNKDPYTVGTGGGLVNWFSDDKGATQPTTVQPTNGDTSTYSSLSLQGKVVTAIMASPVPNGLVGTASFYVVF